MHMLRILLLLLVTTAGVLAFLLYEAITRQTARDAFWSVIVIVCVLSPRHQLNIANHRAISSRKSGSQSSPSRMGDYA
ncbi:MAG TPA: hypothetical protein VKG24_09710, partial [Pseudolabrys sp.]|nr:hypothetical protein [Pseudolabrys sp.]